MQTTSKYFKRHSASQVIRERQIKTTEILPHPVRMSIIKNLIADVGEGLENRNLYSMLLDMQINTAIKETGLETPQKKI